ncbi:MAG: hypothetical protein ACTSX9_05350 [Candidatus Njordarchaeales archaeon]
MRRAGKHTGLSPLILITIMLIWPLIGVLLVYFAQPNPQITVKMFENEALGWTGVLILIAFFIGLGYVIKSLRK